MHVLGAKVYGIPDGAMFNCLAQTRIVWDIASLKPLLRPSTASNSPATTPAEPLDLHPHRVRRQHRHRRDPAQLERQLLAHQ